MKRNMKIMSALLLACLLIIPLLTACSDPEGGENETTAPVAVSDSAVIVEETTADPFEGVNYNDTDFTFLAWKQNIVEYFGDDSKGDMIESAVFKRNSKVESKLGVKLDFIEEAGNSSTFKDFVANANTNINAGNHTYDAIACYSRSASLFMVNGSLTNLYDVQYLDFENDWWPESLVKLNTIGEGLYFASGDIASSLLYQMMFLGINNDKAKEYSISGVQELALEGGWTLDKMFEIMTGVYVDKTGGVNPRDPGNTYGLYVIAHPVLDVFYLGAGLHYVDFDEEGQAVVSADVGGDKSLDLRDRLKQAFWNGNEATGFFHTSSENYKFISSGECLLYVLDGTRLQTYMRNADYDYSILCAPKYNLDQEQYCTGVGFPHSMYCIPIDANDKNMSGAVIEMLAREGYNEVTPVIFETSFKYRYSNGEGDARMFDIIRRGVVFDFGRTMFDQLGGDTSSPIRLWRNDVYQNASLLTTLIKANSKNWSKALTETIASIKDKAAG
ncbi:MAG: hypothetical protein J5919_07305 [Clostridia bacterium]|nr:hypothetical protein [Clostridia bacterium]